MTLQTYVSPHESVPRYGLPAPADFWADYVAPQRPAIFSGLFLDQPIRALQSRADVLAHLGDMCLQFKGEYVEFFLDQVHGRAADPLIGQTMRFADYCAHVDRHPETAGWMGQEQIPDALRARFELPPHCTLADGSADPQVVIHTFIGHPGKSASLHIDTDYKQVLIYEIYGRKRVYLVPASSCLPLRTAGFVSRLDFERLDEQQKVALVTRLGGCCATLYPGDALFLPFSYYHHFTYLDDAMSINIRFGRNRHHEVFTRYMVPHWGLHALAAHLAGEAIVENEGRELYARILDCLSVSAPSAYARYRRIAANLEELALESGAVRRHEGLALELADACHEVPEIATEFIPRFRLDFQKGFWHRAPLDLSGYLDGPAAGRAQAAHGETARRREPDFSRAGAVSLFAVQADLSQVDSALFQPQRGLVALWLRTEFDLFASDEQLALKLSATGRPVPVTALCEALRIETQTLKHIELGQASALIAVRACAYDGRFRGSELVSFLGVCGAL